jgi:hypothetical protein
MTNQLFNLAIIVFSGIAYLFATMWVIKRWFGQDGMHTPAFITVRTAALVAASINLYGISEIASDAAYFFLESGNYWKAVSFSAAFFGSMWAASLVLIGASFLLVGLLTPEKERTQLEANNMELALSHAVILITLAFLISPALVRVANQFIPFPETPF